jgi:hypothetical protein
MQDGIVRGLKAISPAWLAVDVNHLEFGVDLNNYATIAAVALKANPATTYSKTEVDTQFANLIDSAPTALNTLKELVHALGDDANYATTIQNHLATKANTTYVDEQFAIKTFPWFSSTVWDGSSVSSGQRVIDTGPVALVVKSSSGLSGMQVLGSAYGPDDEGRVVAFNGLSVINSLKVDNVNVMSELSGKQSLLSDSILSIQRLICVQHVGTNEIRNNGAAQVTISGDCQVTGNLVAGDTVADRVETTGNLVAGNVLATNTIIGHCATEVTIADNLVITGDLTVQGSSNRSGASSNGNDLSIIASIGFVGFTVPRLTNYPTGVYKITYDQPHPDGANHVVLVHAQSSNSYLTPALVEAPTPQTANYFHLTLRNTTATALTSEVFHFAVVAPPSSTLTASHNYNPSSGARRVDGATASPVSSIGRVGYIVLRPSGQATGIWEIRFDSPAPNNNYVISLMNMNFGTIIYGICFHRR